MYCVKCGANNDGSNKFCTSCGAAMVRVAGKQEMEKVNTHLVRSILVTIFCCQPLGIVALVFSVLAISAQDQGDVIRAKKNAERARSWSFWAIILFFVQMLLTFFFMGVSAFIGHVH